MKKIIVPTDFSTHAEKAYPVAARMAEKYGAEVVFYHILNPKMQKIMYYAAGVLPSKKVDESEIEMYAKEKLQEICDKPVFSKVTTSFAFDRFMDNHPGEEIVDFINRREHMMVVMGTEGFFGHKESVADVVARLAKIPVVTVKDPLMDFNPKRVLYVTNFEDIDPAFIVQLKKLEELFFCRLYVGYINTSNHFKQSEELDMLADKFKVKYKLPEAIFEVCNAKDVKKGVLYLAEKIDADMISIITKGKTGLAHFFSPNTTEHLINHATVPLFTFNEHEYLERVLSHANASYGSHAYTRGFSG